MAICKFCGRKTSSPSGVGGKCSRSPHDRHEWAEEKSEYFCKYCGRKTKSPSGVGGNCSKSPHKKHEWS